LPVALAGLAIVSARALPDAVISEDGRLIGMRTSDGGLAVSRARPNGFTTEDWQKALMAEAVVKPKSLAPTDSPRPRAPLGERFSCTGDLCLARTAGGAIVAYATAASNVAALCSSATLIVIDDPAATNPCASGTATVLTKRDLARRGSASIGFDYAAVEPAEVTFAIDQPYRPWHAHRAFSRDARGMPAYVKKKTEVGPTTQPSAGAETKPSEPDDAQGGAQ